MLPIYKAISIEKAPLVGGSTQPCLLLAASYNGTPVGSYVVKIFKQRNIEQLNSTAKEVYASVLARHFEIQTPDSALIEVEQWLINALKKLPEYSGWDITEGVYFGTVYIVGGLDYNEAVKNNLRRKDWAFLIANPKGGKHLFLEDLSNFHKKEAIKFDHFTENLRNLSPELILGKDAEQLTEYNIETLDYPPIERYLQSAIRNTTHFIESLKSLL